MIYDNVNKIMKRLKIIIITMIICLLTMSIPVMAETEKPTIKVGCFPLNGFYDIADDGTVSGYGAEYTQNIFEYAGWQYEYVIYHSWVEALDGLSKSEIDILAPSQHTAERDELYAFDSFPIGTEYGTLLTLDTNDDLVYSDFESFNGLKVGVVPSLIFLEDFKVYEKRNNFSVDLHYYKDTPAVLSALNAGDVDAVVVNMMVKTDAMKLLARFGAAPIYYMLSPDASYLCDEFNQVIDNVSSNNPELQMKLNEKYFSDFNKLPFSKEELDYISQCGTLKVACGSNYPPFSYIDESTGELTGVDRAILEKISRVSGLQFVYEPIPSDRDIQDFVKEKNITLIAGIENNGYTQLYNSIVSESYLTIPKYFIGKTGTEVASDANLKVAFVTSIESATDSWKEKYPNYEFAGYASIQDCIDAVRSGKADLMMEDRYSIENILASPQNNDLMIFPTEIIESTICFRNMTSDENASVLTSILNKSIGEISDAEKEKMISDYLQATKYKYTVADFVYQYRLQISFAAAILIIILMALLKIYLVRRKAKLAIQENEMKLRNITNNINGGVIVLKANEGLRITYANDGFLELIGCTREQFDSEETGSYLAYVHPDDLIKVQGAIDSDQEEMSLELRVRKNDGSYLPALFNCTVGERSDGHKELYCVILDLTEQVKLLEQLRIEKRRTDLILDRVDEMFYEINMQDHTISTSNSLLAKMGWTLPKRVPELSSEYKKMWHTDQENMEKLRISTEEMELKKEPVSVIVLMDSLVEKRYVWCEVFQHPILDDRGAIVSIIGMIRDVDKQVSERERLIEQAQRDPLTSLYNKEAFRDIVTDTLLKMPRQNHALIFIDLDYFKTLNDTLGHMMGDRAICEASDKMRIIFSNYDVLSRFGGDEFCIFVKDIPIDTLKGKMDWLVEKLHADYCGEKGSVHLTCSCGISFTQWDGYDYDKLMKCADKALYISKEQGRDRYTFFKEGMMEM